MPIEYDAVERLPEELAADALILLAITELDAVVVLLPEESVGESEMQS